jgi:hypothetical protein
MTAKSLVSLATENEKEIVIMYQEKLRIDWTGPNSGFYARYAI